MKTVTWNSDSFLAHTQYLQSDVKQRLFPGGVKNFRRRPEFQGVPGQTKSGNCWFLASMIDYLQKEDEHDILRFFRQLKRNPNWNWEGSKRAVREGRQCKEEEYSLMVVPRSSRDDNYPMGIREGAPVYIATTDVFKNSSRKRMAELVSTTQPGIQLLATAGDLAFGLDGRLNGRELSFDTAEFFVPVPRGSSALIRRVDWTDERVTQELLTTWCLAPTIVGDRVWAVTSSEPRHRMSLWFQFLVDRGWMGEEHAYALTGVECVNWGGQMQVKGVRLVNPWNFSRDVRVPLRDYLVNFRSLIRVNLQGRPGGGTFPVAPLPDPAPPAQD